MKSVHHASFWAKIPAVISCHLALGMLLSSLSYKGHMIPLCVMDIIQSPLKWKNSHLVSQRSYIYKEKINYKGKWLYMFIFCADLKSPQFQIVSSFSTVGVSFKLKWYMPSFFYLHVEPICYFWSKLRDIEWKGLKKSCFYRNCSFASTASKPLPVTAWYCKHVNCLDVCCWELASPAEMRGLAVIQDAQKQKSVSSVCFSWYGRKCTKLWWILL